jgi:hypothetical protein
MLENNTITIANGEVTITYPTPAPTIVDVPTYTNEINTRINQLTNSNVSIQQAIDNNNAIIAKLNDVLVQLG